MSNKRPYTKQKLSLYFDENFPAKVIDDLKNSKNWRKRIKIYSVSDFGYKNKIDKFHYNFCKNKKIILVTLDKDFMNDKIYPFNKIPGIIRIVSNNNDLRRIKLCLSNIISFLSSFPFPKNFIGDSKFQVNPNYCIMRGRHAITREIEEMKIFPGDSLGKVAFKFGYPIEYFNRYRK